MSCTLMAYKHTENHCWYILLIYYAHTWIWNLSPCEKIMSTYQVCSRCVVSIARLTWIWLLETSLSVIRMYIYYYMFYIVLMYILSNWDQNSVMSNTDEKSVKRSNSRLQRLRGSVLTHQEKKFQRDSVGEWETQRENVFILLWFL